MKTLREKMLQEMQRCNYSPRTIASYICAISSLSKHCHQSPDKISLDQVKSFLHHSITNGCSVSYVNQAISAVKLLHEGVLRRKWGPLSIKRPKREKRLPIILSQQEAKAVVIALDNIKHSAILTLGYSAGLRISEVIGLKVSHIDSKRMQVRVVGAKGRKDRYTILSNTALNLLRKYYKRYHPTEWLFEGHSSGKSQYSPTSIGKIIKKACIKARINKAVTYHTLRHCFATHLLEQNTSLQIIQQLLGHSNIGTTSTYLHVQQHSLDKVVSPMDFEP